MLIGFKSRVTTSLSTSFILKSADIHIRITYLAWYFCHLVLLFKLRRNISTILGYWVIRKALVVWFMLLRYKEWPIYFKVLIVNLHFTSRVCLFRLLTSNIHSKLPTWRRILSLLVTHALIIVKRILALIRRTPNFLIRLLLILIEIDWIVSAILVHFFYYVWLNLIIYNDNKNQANHIKIKLNFTPN